MSQSNRLNSDQFATGPFRPHGRVELWAEGKVIYLSAAGPFNMEAVLAIGAAWRQLFADLPAQGLFGDIVIATGSLMAGPDVIRAFGQFLQANTAAKLAPCAVAWVVPKEVEGAMLMIPQFRQVYEAAGRNIAFFETEDAAQTWIRTQLHVAKKGALANSTTTPAAD